MNKTKQKLTFRPAVFIVVYYLDKENNNKPIYLLLRRKLHWKGWEFPKGGVEQGESLINAVKREVAEESGLKPIAVKKYNSKGIYRYDKPLKDRPEMKGQTFSLYSSQVPANKIVKLDKKEHSAYAWLPFDKAIKRLTWPNQKKCLKIVNRQIEYKQSK